MLRSSKQQKSTPKSTNKIKKTTNNVSKRHLSENNHRKLVRTKKRLMLEVPSTPTITEVGQAEAMTTFDAPTTAVSFTHALPNIDIATHPLLSKPTSAQGQMFAIIDVNGSQHKVTKGDQVMVNHLRDVEVGEQLAFEHVYLLAGRDFTVLGKPWVPNVEVHATVEQHTLLAPVTVWKHKRRTGYRNLNRSRDHVTILRIDDLVTEGAKQYIPEVQPLDTIPLNLIQEGGHTLVSKTDDV
jgi:large subunit ribosomal protein L21